jgi:hypothetical protein
MSIKEQNLSSLLYLLLCVGYQKIIAAKYFAECALQSHQYVRMHHD